MRKKLSSWRRSFRLSRRKRKLWRISTCKWKWPWKGWMISSLCWIVSLPMRICLMKRWIWNTSRLPGPKSSLNCHKNQSPGSQVGRIGLLLNWNLWIIQGRRILSMTRTFGKAISLPRPEIFDHFRLTYFYLILQNWQNNMAIKCPHQMPCY